MSTPIGMFPGPGSPTRIWKWASARSRPSAGMGSVPARIRLVTVTATGAWSSMASEKWASPTNWPKAGTGCAAMSSLRLGLWRPATTEVMPAAWSAALKSATSWSGLVFVLVLETGTVTLTGALPSMVSVKWASPASRPLSGVRAASDAANTGSCVGWSCTPNVNVKVRSAWSVTSVLVDGEARCSSPPSKAKGSAAAGDESVQFTSKVSSGMSPAATVSRGLIAETGRFSAAANRLANSWAVAKLG